MERTLKDENFVSAVILLVGAIIGAIVGISIFKPPHFTENDIEQYYFIAESIYDMSDEEIKSYYNYNIIPEKDGYNIILTIRGKGKIIFNFLDNSYNIKTSKIWIVEIIAEIIVCSVFAYLIIIFLAFAFKFFSEAIEFLNRKLS